nr:protein cornichon homolog 4-like [Tanacetum cinerariifolium]
MPKEGTCTTCLAVVSHAMNELRMRQTCHVALKRDHEYINTVEEGSEETHTHSANMLTEYLVEVGEDTQSSYQDAAIELGKEWAKAEGELTGHRHCGDHCVVGSEGGSVGSTVFGTTTYYMSDGGILSPSYLRYMKIKEHPQEIASKSQSLLVLVVYQLMCLADLEFDYINPYDSASRINFVILPEFITHGVLCLIYLLTGHWVMFLLALPYLYYNVRLYNRNQHLVDVTEIFNQLNWEKKQRLFKLGYLVLFLFITLFWMIFNALEDDEM